MKKAVLIFLSFFFISAIPAFADTSGGYGGTNVTVINASSGEVEIQNLQCSAYNSFQLRISGSNNYGDLATGGTCSQNGSNADVTWSSYNFNAHGVVSNYIIAESGSYGTDFSNTFSYTPTNTLWFTENTGNKIGRVTTAGSFTEYVVPTANSAPAAISTRS